LGLGVQKNEIQAFEKSAEKGYDEAEIALLFEKDEGAEEIWKEPIIGSILNNKNATINYSSFFPFCSDKF